MPGIIGSLLLTAVIAYLWGSIPAGYWMGKLLRGKDFDIRDYGSHRTGATNVLRVLGRGPAVIVFLIDISKGIVPTVLALSFPLLNVAGWGPAVAGLMALLGHCYPVFIGFKGGRGVSTGAGTILVLSPLTFLIAAITSLSTISIWRYVSLGSIVGAATSILCGIIFYTVGVFYPAFVGRVSLPDMLFMIIGPSLVIIFHSDNISRLLAGQERKIGQKEVVPTGVK